MDTPISVVSKLPNSGTTIFTVMSAMAAEHNAINLAQGFPDFEAPSALIDLVSKYMQAGKNQYAPMPGVPELRKKIADKTAKLYSCEYDWNSEITIVAGATLGLFCAISAVVRENDEVIIIEPAYDSYAPAIELNGGKPVFARMKSPNFSIDWAEVKKLVNFKTKAILINSPGNPSSAILSSQDLHQLEKIVENTDIVIISDEVYEHIIFDGLEHQSVARYPKLAQRSFIVSSFGKTFHTTGWKIGYVLAPEKLMVEFRKIFQFVLFSTSTPMQYAICDFLDNEEHYLQLGKFYQNKRDLFRNLLKNSRFKLYNCSGSYFQLLGYEKISDKNDFLFATELTQNVGVAAIPMSSFYRDKTDNKILRFCFAKKDETIEAAAKKLLQL